VRRNLWSSTESNQLRISRLVGRSSPKVSIKVREQLGCRTPLSDRRQCFRICDDLLETVHPCQHRQKTNPKKTSSLVSETQVLKMLLLLWALPTRICKLQHRSPCHQEQIDGICWHRSWASPFASICSPKDNNETSSLPQPYQEDIPRKICRICRNTREHPQARQVLQPMLTTTPMVRLDERRTETTLSSGLLNTTRRDGSVEQESASCMHLEGLVHSHRKHHTRRRDSIRSGGLHSCTI